MKSHKIFLIVFITVAFGASTKLHDSLPPGTNDASGLKTQALLNNTYDLLITLLNKQDEIFSLKKNSTGENPVLTRGGDCGNNGVWRVLHEQKHDETYTQALLVFKNLGQIESNAIAVLASNPTKELSAQAIFLRSLAQYYYLSLFGQVPYQTVDKYHSIEAAPVMSPQQVLDTLTNSLLTIIPNMTYAASNSGLATSYKANPDAARFLLMKVLLNKQSFLNRENPADAIAEDMQQVITLGNAIINSGKYALTSIGSNNESAAPDYAFDPATEAIFSFPNHSGEQQENDLKIFRYGDVLLMMAEAHLRQNNTAAALTFINQLRTERKVAPLATVKLVNASDICDENTLLSERRKELNWECWRREDLIRFGVFLKSSSLRTTDDRKYLLFPIPATELLANPNLKQNPGY